MFDVPLSADCFHYYAGLATKIEGSTIPVSGPFLTYTLREPIGVMGLITPWNFPMLLAARKLAVALAAGNAIIEDAIMVVRKGVESGLTLAQPLKDTKVFPPMVVQMIGVGEQTGALDAMLSKIADFYEEEVDQAVANLLTLLEPVMILFLGVTVGGIIIAMYLPLFDLISKLS